MSAAHQIVDHFKLLGRQAELLAQVYTQGEILKTEENQGRINELSSRRVLSATAQPSIYRLAAGLTDHLNSMMKRNNVFGSASDCSQFLQEITRLRDRYIDENGDDPDEETLRGLERDFDDTVNKMGSTIKEQLIAFEHMARSEFGHAKSSASRERQNKEAIKQAKMLGDALKGISSANVLDEYRNNPRAALLWMIYQRELLSQRNQWVSDWKNVLELLIKYLNRQREFNIHAQQFRYTADQLRKGYLDPEVSLHKAFAPNYPEARRWLCPARSTIGALAPDVADYLAMNVAEDVAVKLPKDTIVKKQVMSRIEQIESSVVREKKEQTPQSGTIQRCCSHDTLVELLSLLGAPVSANQWLSECDASAPRPSTQAFLNFILNLHDKEKHWPNDVIIDVVREPVPEACGNIIVTDIILKHVSHVK